MRSDLSVCEMECQSDELMVVDQKPRARTEKPNLVTGVYLKSVFFLDEECSKLIIVGIFQNKGNSVGIVFKNKKKVVYWSLDVFNQFMDHANNITGSFESCKNYKAKLDSGEDIQLKNVFGRWYVYLFDGCYTLSLTHDDWTQFTNNLPCIRRQLRELFMSEDLFKIYILDILSSEEDFVPPPEGLPAYLVDRLFDEVQKFKRWPNGGRS